MAKHIFNKEELFDTVELGELTFTLNMNDEKIRNFRKTAATYTERAQAVAKIDTTKMTEPEIEQLNNEASDMVKTVIDEILGAGSYAAVYEELGENTFHVVKFVEYLFGILEDKLKESKLIAAEKYTQKTKMAAVIEKKKGGK